ncbi:unnamed protein product [Lymnaea stagnalis]|uniref:MOSC domain-containing protein n=1 Tax=Lymnaea stagnalis TaxID=6523 RepID=A0AAV2I798_LYMST
MATRLLSQSDHTIMAAVVAGAAVGLTMMAVVGHNHRKLFQQIGTVANLYIYPVKSCGAMEVSEANCTPVGLESNGVNDRHWMILDPSDHVITMKEEPRLTLVKCRSVDGRLLLEAPGMDHLQLPQRPDLRTRQRQHKILLGQAVTMVCCGGEAEKWISEFLGRSARMVFSCRDLGPRDVHGRPRRWPNTARQGDITIFAYLTSYLVTNTASLQSINGQMTTPASMISFRPNIAVRHTEAFDEDNWLELRIGENVLFHAVEPCRRCPITTIDPNTAEVNLERQPLELLKSFRCRPPYGTAPIFGLYVSLDLPGRVKVGDPVYVMRKK